MESALRRGIALGEFRHQLADHGLGFVAVWILEGDFETGQMAGTGDEAEGWRGGDPDVPLAHVVENVFQWVGASLPAIEIERRALDEFGEAAAAQNVLRELAQACGILDLSLCRPGAAGGKRNHPQSGLAGGRR